MQRGMAGAAPEHPGILHFAVVNVELSTLRLKTVLDPFGADLFQPGALAVDIHGHQVFVEEGHLIDIVFPLKMLDHIDQIAGGVVADIPAIGEADITLSVAVRPNQHVAGGAEMPAVLADETATVTAVDVDASLG